MKKHTNKKGITLIELIITLSLIGVITLLVFSFLFSNKKTFDRVETKTDLQYEAKIIMNKISKVAMEAVNGRVIDTLDNKIIAFDILDSSDGSIVENGIKFIFNDNVIMSEEGSSQVELSNSKDINISVDATVNDRQSIKLNLILKKKGITYSVEDSFVFRNSHIN